MLPFSFFSYYQNSATTAVTNSRVFWQQQLSNLINEWIKMIIFTEWEHPVLHFYSNCAPEEYHWVYCRLLSCFQALIFPLTILTLQAPKSYCMCRLQAQHWGSESPFQAAERNKLLCLLWFWMTLKTLFILKGQFSWCSCKPEVYIKVGD